MFNRLKITSNKLATLLLYITSCYLVACGSDIKENSVGYNNISDSNSANQVEVISNHMLMQDKDEEIHLEKKATEVSQIIAADTYQTTNDNTQLKTDKSQMTKDNTKVVKDNNQLKTNKSRLVKDNSQLTKDNAKLVKDNNQLKTNKSRLVKDNSEPATNTSQIVQDDIVSTPSTSKRAATVYLGIGNGIHMPLLNGYNQTQNDVSIAGDDSSTTTLALSYIRDRHNINISFSQHQDKFTQLINSDHSLNETKFTRETYGANYIYRLHDLAQLGVELGFGSSYFHLVENNIFKIYEVQMQKTGIIYSAQLYDSSKLDIIYTTKYFKNDVNDSNDNSHTDNEEYGDFIQFKFAIQNSSFLVIEFYKTIAYSASFVYTQTLKDNGITIFYQWRL